MSAPDRTEPWRMSDEDEHRLWSDVPMGCTEGLQFYVERAVALGIVIPRPSDEEIAALREITEFYAHDNPTSVVVAPLRSLLRRLTAKGGKDD